MKNKNYPIVEGSHKYFVRHPVLINIAMHMKQQRFNYPLVPLEPGKWMTVDVFQDGGYNILAAPVLFDTEAECQKACDVHNKFHGWTKDEANEIISESMKFKHP